ncbi:MAG: alpha/beta hydrolase [Anaerolineales bacterium]|nr:alpha/beta hydrolase [Anaerolineales bacterium]
MASLAGAAIVGPLLVPIPPLRGCVPPQTLAGAGSRFIDVTYAGDTLSVHYEEAGQGAPTFLLLHGFAASTFSWREVLPAFARWGRTVAFDRPAFGLTGRPMPEDWRGNWMTHNPYSVTAQAELTVALMDRLDINQAILVGNSAGGAVAMLAALAYPERVQALVLIDPAVYQGGNPSSFLRRLFNTPQMRHIGPLIARRIQGWGRNFARSAWHDPARITETVWEGYLKPLRAQDWDRALWELTAANAPADLPQRLSAFTLPVLVITGDNDRIVPTAQSIRLAAELPNAELVVVPNCGHLPHEECPQAVLDAIERFVRTRSCL